MAGLPDDKIVEAHGSFANAHCLSCRDSHSADDLRPKIDKGEVVRCEREKCKGKANARQSTFFLSPTLELTLVASVIKPDIV